MTSLAGSVLSGRTVARRNERNEGTCGVSQFPWSFLRRWLRNGACRCALLVAVALFSATATTAATLDFVGVPEGTRLTTELPGITFALGARVVPSPTGKLAAFNDFPGCEFCASRGKLTFSALQRSVTIHVGLLPIPSGVFQQTLRMSAFDTAGAQVASTMASVTTGAGTATLTLSAASARIANITLGIDNVDNVGTIALRDIALEAAPQGPPDFLIEVPPAWSLLAGAAATDMPITIRRFSGSAGVVTFTTNALPASVSAGFVPNQASGDSAVLRLQSLQTTHVIQLVTITATPSSDIVGLAVRTATFVLESNPRFTVQGRADLDFAGCAPSGSRGTISSRYSVVRDDRVTGPLKVDIADLPPDVIATVAPQTLTFAAGAIGDSFVLSLTAIAGPAVPDHTITLRLTGPNADLRVPVEIHGACPQQNRNFVMRGQYRVIDRGVDASLQRAQVEFFRYRSDWYDDKVGETETDADGRYSMDLFASIDGDYYARLRLANGQLHLMDADNSSVWSIDTSHRSNRGGLIDNGTVTISRDGGSGTPRAAVWQAFRRDIEDLAAQNPLGFVPGGFLGIVIYRGHVTPLTFYDEVHWPPGYSSSATTHEFGHVLRHSLDGDGNHWNQDNFEYLYGRSHTHCTQDGVANAGYGFNEGWADYWAGNVGCCPNDLENPFIEGTVAQSLNTLAACQGVGRNGMLRVLGSGQNVVHSEGQFRTRYAQQFPSCAGAAAQPINAGCLAGAGSPLAVVADSTSSEGWQSWDHALAQDIEDAQRELLALRKRQAAARGVVATLLRGSVAEAELTMQRLRERQLHSVGSKEHLLRAHEDLWERELLRRRILAVRLRVLRDALALPDAPRADVQRRLRMAQQTAIEDAAYAAPFAEFRFADDAAELTAIQHRRYDLLTLAGMLVALVLVTVIVIAVRASRKA